MDDPVDDIIAAEAPAGARHIWILGRPGLVDAARAWAPVSVWCDDLRLARRVDRDHPGEGLLVNPLAEAATERRAGDGVDARAGRGADARVEAVSSAGVPQEAPHQVWMELPESLDALDETLSALHGLAARHGIDDLHVVAGGRIRRMNRSMNEVGLRWFDDVSASLGRRRARVLHMSGPRSRPARGSGWPRRQHIDSLDLDLVAHGGVFHVAGLDAGTALLLDQLPSIGRHLPDNRPAEVLDLGCGNGVIAASVAKKFGARVLVRASDVSWAAADSTAMTAAANGLDIAVRQADGLTGVPDSSLDVIVTNPPFHRGSARDSGPTHRMLAEAGRVLRPGGQLWCVYNSHLPWGRYLDERVGPTRQVARTRAYTVTRTICGS